MYRNEGDTPAADTAGATTGAGTGLGPLLVSLQLTDSAFPSGFYTLSHSLEGFAQAGAVDPDSLPLLLRDLLLHGVGPADATALALAHRATAAGDPAAAVRVDEHLFATKLGREMRQAATRTGRQLLDLGREVFDRPEIGDYFDRVVRREAPGTQAVAAGVIYAATRVPVRQAVAADLFAFCVSFAGAALRLRLTDHRTAQTLIRGAAPVIEETVEAALRRELDDVGATVFASDIMSGRHERAEARLFAS
ncbi:MULTISPECIES: urease accessory protein UreF [unclassified Streptomyces]|uniref:urease accessory protein UreF n=1 Tax=unclassified Streptomyces TaxID=2593676 RepID=UPI002557B491|nr:MULTISPECIES: urease accessory UreF family protein [unclassified Streptomyces]WRZ68987.1 urease accessory protein [Streptomyces sp. NBC_01257]WSU62936.1 urease accessory protein [Streptomyces sp. NBC_01104]